MTRPLRTAVWLAVLTTPLLAAAPGPSPEDAGVGVSAAANAPASRSTPPPSAVPASADDAERLLFLLDYIRADYGMAVANGAILDPFEFDEMIRFSARLIESFETFERHGATAEVRQELDALRDAIVHLRPWPEIRERCGQILARLHAQIVGLSMPDATPDLQRGARIFQEACASCHGPEGAGDGPAPRVSGPAPRSLRQDWMALISTHHVWSAVSFGIEGTAMASFADALSPAERWDVAFFVKTLYGGAGEAPALMPLPLDLRDWVLHTDEQLHAMLAAKGPATQGHLAYIRHRPALLSVAGQGVPSAATETVLAEPSAPSDDADAILDTALRLQDAFALVAQRVRPSVVGITAYRHGAAGGVGEDAPAAGWTVSRPEDLLYPGFERVCGGSGFVVTDDGYVLSSRSIVVGDDGVAADVVDIELSDGTHVLGRVVGTEPTLGLAVLKLGAFAELEVPPLGVATLGDSDAVQVGHWVIALGDPDGAAETFAVGTLSARAERQCYQEELSRTLLQASLSLHPESQGGPLVDIRGAVVGIVLPRPVMAGSVGASFAHEVALPINLARGIFEALRVTESVESPWLGFSVLELATERRRLQRAGLPSRLPTTGVVIDDVFVPSPASAAGLRVGDVLVGLDGNRLFSVLEFQRWLYMSGIGRRVALEVIRDGEPHVFDVEIEARPPDVPTH